MAQPNKGIIGWIWYLGWRFLLLLVLIIVVLRFIPLPTTAFMLQSPYPVKQDWISIEKLPSHVALAVVASEDQLFPDHFGLDLNAIGNALKDYGDGDSMRGASTISQQTAKNLFLWPGRSFIRKGLEAGLTLSLEAIWGKKRILEVYLNVAEFGQGIYGVEAASRHYFNKSAQKLTVDEATRLAVLLPSPRKRNPNRLTPSLYQRVYWIKRQMRQLGPDYLAPIL